MSSTMTITAKTVASLSTGNYVVYRQPSKEDVANANDLADILLKYKDCRDECSTRLFKWGANVLKVGGAIENDAAFAQVAKRKLTHLFYEILQNPHNPGVPLQDPWLDRKMWIWEKKDLDKHLKMSAQSPYDSHQINAEPHYFASAMLNWAKRLQSGFGGFSESTQKELISAFPTQTAVTVVSSCQWDLFSAILLAQQAISRSKQREVRNESRKLANGFKKHQAELNEEVRAKTEVLKQNQEKHEKVINNKISAIEEMHQKHVQVIQKDLNDKEQRLTQATTQLNAVQLSLAQKAQQIQHLQWQYSQKDQEVQNMKNQDKGFCVIS